MATCEPFRALRYNAAKVASLEAVTAPPYDVIDAELQRELCADPYNIVHLDLNPATTDLNAADNRYRTAARLLGQWRDAEILQRDSSPAFYVYEQVYDWLGEQITRRSFVTRLRLVPLGQGVYPHERTFSGPKEDRFNLTVATRCNLSQVLGLYPDPAAEVMGQFAATCQRAPDMCVTGRDGVVNRVWLETDPDVLEAVTAGMAERPLYIADGHHRYETALRYQRWLEEAEPLPDDHPARYTTMVCVGSGDSGLRVMPTHRILRGLTGFEPEALRRALAPWFDWQPADVDPRDGAALERWIDGEPLSALGLLVGDEVGALRPRRSDLLAEKLPEASSTLRLLNVSLLHQLVLPEVVEPSFGSAEIQYVHRAGEAVEAIARGAEVAFLLRATPLDSVLEVAGHGELMPQKSTYFYPKALTGLVMYPLRD